MSKALKITCILFIAYFIYGIYLNGYPIKVTQDNVTQEKNALFNDYKGVINVHSNNSTGTGTYSEIFEAAEKAKLDFIVFTDLNNFKNFSNLNYYQNNVLGITAAEYSYLDARVLYVKNQLPYNIKNLGEASVAITNQLANSGLNKTDTFTVLAHPTKAKYSWTGEYPIGLDGLEIINLKSLWQDSWLNKKITFLWSFIIYPFNSDLAFLRLLQRAEKEIKIWDQLNEKKLRIGFAGSDAESRFNFFKTPLRFPSYESLFGIVSNHVLIRSELTGNYEKDQLKIFNSIKNGQFYMSLDMIGDPAGFYFYARSNQKNIYMGATSKLTGNDQIVFNIPKSINRPYKIKVYRNDVMIQNFSEKRKTISIKEPGVYKAVVYVKISLPIPEGRKWFPWIITNGIKFN